VRYGPRLLLTTGAAALVPLLLLGLGARAEVSRRLEANYQRRIQDGLNNVLGALRADAEDVASRLAGVRRIAEADNALRPALVAGPPEPRALIDYAGGAMRSAGLDLLELRDGEGRLLSSGQFRNQYGVRDSMLLPLLDSLGGPVVLLRTRLAGGGLTVVAGHETFSAAGRQYTLIGGRAIDPSALARLLPGEGAEVTIAVPGSERDSSPRAASITGVAKLPMIDAGDAARAAPAELRLSVSRAPLDDVLRGLDRWFLAALAVSAAAALLISAVVARRMSRPLRVLAAEAERVDLDRLHYDFGAGRRDEIGALGGMLEGMIRRLAASAERLTDAERRAAVGDLSRQLSHDIKNGLAPIRNILRHLDKVAKETPGRLSTAFAERRANLESSLAYLDDLARRYAARLPDLAGGRTDLRPLLEELAREHAGNGIEITLSLPPALPVAGDGVALRRIFENLLGNACDAMTAGPGGRVTLTGRLPSPAGPRQVRVEVMDEGPGMTERELQRAFSEAPSTKVGGSGLGLSIVRRLVLEGGGALRVETAPGSGTRVLVDLPLARDGEDS